MKRILVRLNLWLSINLPKIIPDTDVTQSIVVIRIPISSAWNGSFGQNIEDKGTIRINIPLKAREKNPDNKYIGHINLVILIFEISEFVSGIDLVPILKYSYGL